MASPKGWGESVRESNERTMGPLPSRRIISTRNLTQQEMDRNKGITNPAGYNWDGSINATTQASPVQGTQNKVLSDFQKAQESANKANETRYQQILEKYNQLAGQQSQAISGVPQEFQGIADQFGQRTNTAQQMAEGLGNTQREELQDRYEQQKAGTQQDLINRGLTNSTAYDAAIRGNTMDYEKNKRALEENIQRQKLGLYTQLSGDQLQAQGAVPRSRLDVAGQTFGMQEKPLGVMERRNDIGPSFSDISNYATAIGQGNAFNPYAGMSQGQGGQTYRSPTFTGYLDLA